MTRSVATIVALALLGMACGGGDDESDTLTTLDGDACFAAFRTAEAAVQAWYASEEEGDPASFPDLVDAGLVAPNSGLDEYVVLIEGPPTEVRYVPACNQ